MASSSLEELRSRQEDIELLEDAIAYIMKQKKQNLSTKGGKFGLRSKILHETAIKLILLEIQSNANICLQIYEDKDGMRKQENAFLAGITGDKSTSSFSEIWPRYYEKIKNIKNYNKKFQQKSLPSHPEDRVQIAEKYLRIVEDFVGDEDIIFDLNECFNLYLNMQKIKVYRISQFRSNEITRLKKKGLKDEDISNKNFDEAFQEIDYVYYLKHFFRFDEIPRYCKYNDEDYENYIEKLLTSVVEFFRKLYPLSNDNLLFNKLEEEFRKKWEAREVEDWEEYTCENSLYCKVTDKLFSSQGVLDSHKRGRKYKKKLTELMGLSMEEQNNLTNLSHKKDEEIAIKEFFIRRLADILNEHIDKAIEVLQKNQSKTAEELQLSESDEDKDDGDEFKDDKEEIEDDDEDEKPIYNPLNLPLGWDGKPIAYWLYKLHGLGIEYKCEICGNYSYWGRKSFEKHFQEWRHSFGMRCLKIPNTVHFKEITKIEDAITLYEKLRKEADFNTFKNETEVECEDSQGNVLSMRDYHDLLKQGLL